MILQELGRGLSSPTDQCQRPITRSTSRGRHGAILQSPPHLGACLPAEGKTRLLAGPPGLQPVRKPQGLNIDETVEIRINKVESALGGGGERVKTELLSRVFGDPRVREGVLQHLRCVVRSFEILP